MKKYLQYWPIIAAVLLFSCGPQAKLRRAAKLIARAELQGAVWKSDTVFKTIVVPVPQVTTDTIFTSEPGDTVTIFKERLRVSYVRLKGDSVFIEAACLPDTIEVIVPTIVNREIKAKGKGWTFYAAWFLILLIIGFIAGWIVRGKKGNININFEKPPDQQ